MEQKLSTGKLEHLMPHKGKMIWVDHVLQCESDGGEVETSLKEDFPYFTEGKLIRSFFLEFMAQGYGYYRAAQVLDQNLEGLDKAMIPMISRYQYEEKDYLPGMKIKAKLKTVKELGNLFFVQGECFDESENLIASAEFKVYAKADL